MNIVYTAGNSASGGLKSELETSSLPYFPYFHWQSPIQLQGVLFDWTPPLNKQSQGPFIKCQIFNFKDWVYTQQNMNWTPPPVTVCSRGLKLVFCL